MDSASAAGDPLVVPEAPEQRVGLEEPEQVLGQGDLGHARPPGPARSTRRPAPGRSGVSLLGVRPEVEVVVEHGAVRPQPAQAARRISVTPSRIVVSDADHPGIGDQLVVEGARRARAPWWGSSPRRRTPPPKQGVVDDDEAVRRQLGQHRLEVGVVALLVGVDEDQVERPRERLETIAIAGPLVTLDVARRSPAVRDVGPGRRGVVRIDLAAR